MRKKNKAIIFIIIMVVVLGVVAVASFSGHPILLMNTAESQQKMAELGEVEGERIANTSEEIAVKGTDFVIYNSEVEAVVKRNEALGTGKSREDVIQSLLEREVLYAYAIKNGYDATDEEVYAQLELLKTASKQAANSSDVESFIAGTGLTEEEYWQSQFEITKKTVVLNKFAEDFNQKFESENDVTGMDSQERYTLEREAMKKLTQELVEAENCEIMN